MLTSAKPEDKPKVIALAGAVAAVFIVGGVNIFRTVGGGGAPAPASPATTPSASADAAPGSPPPVASASSSSSTPMIDGAMYVPRPRMPVDKLAVLQPNFGADPFRPIVPAKVAPIVVPNPVPANPIITQVPGAAYLALGAPHPTPAPVAPAPVVVPLKLTGVVAGVDAIAMIGDGAGEHFLHRGDSIQGYHIVKIEEDAVTLRRANAGKILRVGTDGSELISFAPVKALPATKLAAVKPAAAAAAPVTSTATKATIPSSKPKATPDHSPSPGSHGTATANQGADLVATAAVTRHAATAHGATTAQPASSASTTPADTENKGR